MKKIITLLIALYLISNIAACDVSTGEVEVTDIESDNTVAQSEISEAMKEYYSLKDADYGGYEFNALVYSDAMSPLTFFTSEIQTGDIIDDVIFLRNKTVEEKYNVKLNFAVFPTRSNMAPTMLASVLAGDHAYDLYIPHTSEGPIGMLTDNLVYN